METKVYKMGDSFDSSNSEEIKDEIMALLEEGDANLIIDLSDCTYVSSAGLRVFLMTYKAAETKGVKTCLSGLNYDVKELMSVSGFDNFFVFYDTVEDAKEAIG